MSAVNRWAGTLLGLILVSAHAAPLRPPAVHAGAIGIDRTEKPHVGAVRDAGSTPAASTHPIRASRTYRTPAAARALTIRIARQHGTTNKNVRCLITLWTRESNFRPQALNRSSGAGGIPQILGMNPNTPTHRQIQRGLAYIQHRYQTPCNALAHHNRRGWY